jgi:hypothetical protein
MTRGGNALGKSFRGADAEAFAGIENAGSAIIAKASMAAKMDLPRDTSFMDLVNESILHFFVWDTFLEHGYRPLKHWRNGNSPVATF